MILRTMIRHVLAACVTATVGLRRQHAVEAMTEDFGRRGRAILPLNCFSITAAKPLDGR
jgi:hypothetical protein